MQHQIGLPSMLKRGALSLIADIVTPVYDCRSSRLSSSHSSKANGSLALLPSLALPPRIEQMSRINARSPWFLEFPFILLLDLLVSCEQATRLSHYGAESVV